MHSFACKSLYQYMKIFYGFGKMFAKLDEVELKL